MPHESTVKHDEVLSGNMDNSHSSAYGRRYSYPPQVGKRNVTVSLSETTAPRKGVEERQKGMESSSVGGISGKAANRIHHTFTKRPAEFTQTTDVYDDDDSADAAVAVAARPMRSGEEEDSSESGNRTPLEFYKSVNSSFERLEIDGLDTVEHF
jgi:hypothetical protein